MYFLDLLMLSLYLILTMQVDTMLPVHEKQSVVADYSGSQMCILSFHSASVLR